MGIIINFWLFSIQLSLIITNSITLFTIQNLDARYRLLTRSFSVRDVILESRTVCLEMAQIFYAQLTVLDIRLSEHGESYGTSMFSETTQSYDHVF